ncbi:MAG: hypothetical protein OK436_05180 [Thaumarchaeota archaeon]|nr:hypothetical protein [Nitrososphaerota archaeon]
MTLDEFLEKLKETPRDWEIKAGGLIRRGDSGTVEYACPLGELITDPDICHRLNWMRAGRILGLSDNDAYFVKMAADGRRSQPDLRKRLLEACGLVEDWNV